MPAKISLQLSANAESPSDEFPGARVTPKIDPAVSTAGDPIMDWFFSLMELVVVAGQVAACLYMAYGAWLSVSHLDLSIPVRRVALKPIEVWY